MKQFTPKIRIFSFVGGGPHERMYRELKARGLDVGISQILSPGQWRALSSRGTMGRILARAITYGVYPAQALLEAFKMSLLDVQGHPLSKPVCIAITNPFFLPHLMVLTKPLHRCAVVTWLYDMYPDALEAAGIHNPVITTVMSAANKWLIRHSDAVVHLGEVLRESAEKRYGTNPNSYTIPTAARQSEFTDVPAALDKELAAWMEGRVIFSYVGNMGLLHDKDTLEKGIPEFLAGLSEEERSKVGFIFAASGPNEAKLRAALADNEICKGNVRFIGPLPDAPWADLLVHTNVALATLDDQALAASVPCKMYSAIASACIPLAIMSPNAELPRLIAPNGNDADDAGGLVVKVGAVSDLVEAFHRCMDPEKREKYLKQVKRLADTYDISAMAQRWCDCVDAAMENSGKPLGTALYHGIKRLGDVCAAGAGLGVLLPVLAGTALAVKKNLGSPILFKQMRPGKDGKPFELLKFRSMANAEPGTDASHDGERLSEFGKKLRALSLDELPSLLNVLKGDLSLVGPRPLLMSYLERYNEHQRKRLWAKPGVTGWAQVNGRNALSWDEKFDLDVWYVEHASILLDLKILFKTLSTVLKRSGINHSESATMPEFMGNGGDHAEA